jgi:hypothetical protein
MPRRPKAASTTLEGSGTATLKLLNENGFFLRGESHEQRRLLANLYVAATPEENAVFHRRGLSS